MPHHEPSRRARRENERKRKSKPLLRRPAFWVPTAAGLFVLAVGVVFGWVGIHALDAKRELEAAIPLASKVQQQVLATDQHGAAATAQHLREKTKAARVVSNDVVWRSVEWVPFIGSNLHAVRVASEAVDDLTANAVMPATTISIDAFKPVNGRIDVEAVERLGGAVNEAQDALAAAKEKLASIDRGSLIDQVANGIAKLDATVNKASGMLDGAANAVALLPEALGADGPRKYLLLFQNNAESRGTGGNPAAVALITATDGRIDIAQQASSADFNNGRPQPVTELDPETVALYGDKIGRWMQDVTLTPDFTETAGIIRAFWKDSFGEDVDAVASFDPVALSYLLKATGPVTLPTGEQLTAENAVPLLLNEVYSKYPDPQMQDLFFAAAAGSVFDAVTSGNGDLKKLIGELGHAIDEGRLMYAPSDPDEAALIEGTRLAGQLPADNIEKTMVGVYVNDITEGKLDYYADLGVTTVSDQCTAESPTYTTTAAFASTLQPDQVAGLARYISPGRFFPKGVISTDLVFYGPVGATFAGATVDGAPVSATPVTHLGRPAVKVNIENPPGTSHTVAVTFTGAAEDYGPLEAWHTPMVRPTAVTIDAPGCAAAK